MRKIILSQWIHKLVIHNPTIPRQKIYRAKIHRQLIHRLVIHWTLGWTCLTACSRHLRALPRGHGRPDEIFHFPCEAVDRIVALLTGLS